MEKWRFWVLTCIVLIHNEVFHNKLLLNTCAFLVNFLFSRLKFSFYSICIICLISHKTYMWNMWYFKQKIRKIIIEIETSRIAIAHLLPWSDQENCLYITLTEYLIKLHRHCLIYKILLVRSFEQPRKII